VSLNNQFLADSFSSQCYQLLGYYSKKKRIKEWLPIDSILRSLVSVHTGDAEWSILNYAYQKMEQNAFKIADDLASYDLLFSKERYPSTIDYRLGRIHSEWISLNSRYKEWLSLPYYNRNTNFSLKQDFRDIIRHLNNEQDSLVKFNPYESNGYVPFRRTLFYRIYKETVLAYADWSINDHREGQAILPLKDFIFNRLIRQDIEPALKANTSPAISCTDINNLYSRLCQLYLNIGNGKEASAVSKAGIALINKHTKCTGSETLAALTNLFYLQTKADRLQGKYEMALKRTAVLKQWNPLPPSVKTSMNSWNWYIEVRLQEVYTLLEQKKLNVAVDSLTVLLNSVDPISNDSVDLLRSSYQWPQLQFISMQYMAKKGRWDAVRDYTLDALTVLEQDNHWENVSYYYDLQLLFFISKYRTEKVLLKNVINNLLFYTGRHLQHSFFMLTPEDRIRLYEQKLSVYFDVYHELVMSGLIDDDTTLKNNIINQSLSLKNGLIDANLLPNEVLAQNNEIAEIIEEIRTNRSKSNATLARWRMTTTADIDLASSDGAQLVWLTILENANLDSLSAFTGSKKIAAALKPNQVYVETVRYTNWLTDSASMYAAYVIKDGQLQTQQLFNEQQMLKLLRDPLASPQSGVLNGTNTRGFTLTKKDTSIKKFKPGSEDKLGKLVLSSLWKHISGKSQLLLVPDGLLNRISIAALEYQHKPLFTQFMLKQLSGSYVLHQKNKPFPIKGKALLAGGLNYGQLKPEVNINRLLNQKYSWQYLPATKKETEQLQAVFKTAGEEVNVLSGEAFHDSLITHLSNYDLIHLATHGFYVDSATATTFYDGRWNKEAIQNDPMMRCGIAVSNANFPNPKEHFTEGYLLGFELANTDLRKCYLISLSACETGLGDLRNNLGVDGLSRALKLGGARFLLISLWKVPDAPTAVFMQQFYKELFRLKDPAAALQSTQLFMSKKYDVADWAAFVLVE